MRKLLTIIAALIMCNAYGEAVTYVVDGAEYETTTCDSNGNISMPTKGTPTKAGYRFMGWRPATTLSDYLPANGTSVTPSGRTPGTVNWTTTFSYGTVSGEWRCSTDIGTVEYHSTSNPSTSNNPSLIGGCGSVNPSCSNINSNAKGCWCKMTNAGPLSDFIDVSSLAWVYTTKYDYAYNSTKIDCASYCAARCSAGVKTIYNFRKTVFGVTQ